MSLERYCRLLSLGIKNAVIELNNLNKQKGEKFKLILEAYKRKDSNLLLNTLSELGDIIDKQEKITSRLYKGSKTWEKIVKNQLKIIKKWYHVFYTQRMENFETIALATITAEIWNINSKVKKQKKIFKKIAKDPLKVFFTEKAVLNESYSDEIISFDKLMATGKYANIEVFEAYMQALLDKFKGQIAKAEGKKREHLELKINAALFLLITANLIKSIGLKKENFLGVFKQVREIETMFRESVKEGKGGRLNTASLIANVNMMNNAMGGRMMGF